MLAYIPEYTLDNTHSLNGGNTLLGPAVAPKGNTPDLNHLSHPPPSVLFALYFIIYFGQTSFVKSFGKVSYFLVSAANGNGFHRLIKLFILMKPQFIIVE